MVIHLLVDSCTTFSELFAQNPDTASLNADELIRLGAVYVNKIRCEPEDLSRVLKPGDYVRIHARPKRYTLPAIPIQEIIVAETEDFYVINKPGGIPVHPTLDNAQENLQLWIAGALNRSRTEVLIGQRLDIGTEGLLVVPKHAEALRKFNFLLSEGKVTKKYECLHTGEPLQAGILRDHMKKTREAPKQLDDLSAEGNLECLLQVESSELAPKMEAEPFIHTRVKLLTGRTHQIRVQLAHRGRPIVGDQMYGSPWRPTGSSEQHALRCYRIEFPWKSSHQNYELGPWGNPSHWTKS